MIPATGNRCDDALEAEAGLAIVESLTAAGEAGLTGDDLLIEAARRGVPPTRAVLVRGRLWAGTRIECGHGTGARWRTAGEAAEAHGSHP